MKDIIKAIREQAGLSQEQFARELGTTAVSINRWENGKTGPNKMAQKQLTQFCKAHQIQAAELIQRDCEYEPAEDRLILYHGSRQGIEGEIAPISRKECDFGRGFYMGTSTLQPLTLVCAEERPVFYTVELSMKGLKLLELPVGMEWAMLIAYHRGYMEQAAGTAIYEKYKNLTKGYDVVTGFIANDRMYTELTNFFQGTITDTALMKCLAALDLGRQYVAISEKACRQISILKERKLTEFELSALQEKSVAYRREGISLADEIVRKYRREGRFFDEILKEG